MLRGVASTVENETGNGARVGRLWLIGARAILRLREATLRLCRLLSRQRLQSAPSGTTIVAGNKKYRIPNVNVFQFEKFCA